MQLCLAVSLVIFINMSLGYNMLSNAFAVTSAMNQFALKILFASLPLILTYLMTVCLIKIRLLDCYDSDKIWDVIKTFQINSATANCLFFLSIIALIVIPIC